MNANVSRGTALIHHVVSGSYGKYLLCILLSILFSCNQIHKKYVPYGSKKLRQITYDDRNNIIGEQQFTITQDDTVADGFYREYYPSKILRAESFYKMGFIDSVSTTYFEDGTLKGFYNVFEGKLMGKQVEHYQNGSTANIALADGSDSILFSMHCSQKGEVEIIKGVPLYIYMKKRTLPKQQTFTITHNIIKEKDLFPILTIKIINSEGKVVFNKTPTDFYTFQNNHLFDFVGKFEDSGTYLYTVNIKLLKGKDTIVDKNLVDTLKIIN